MRSIISSARSIKKMALRRIHPGIYTSARARKGAIQVYDAKGQFLYGFIFPTHGGWFTFGIDHEDRIHVVTARTDSHFIYDDGTLFYAEENIDYERSQSLEKTYNMSDGANSSINSKSYSIGFFNTVTVWDKDKDKIEKIHLKDVPVWPFPVMVYWLFAAAGMVPVFIMVYKAFYLDFKDGWMGKGKRK